MIDNEEIEVVPTDVGLDEAITHEINLWFTDGESECVEQRQSDLAFAKIEGEFLQFKTTQNIKVWLSCDVIERIEIQALSDRIEYD